MSPRAAATVLALTPRQVCRLLRAYWDGEVHVFGDLLIQPIKREPPGTATGRPLHSCCPLRRAHESHGEFPGNPLRPCGQPVR